MNQEKDGTGKRSGYHHGNLRDHLIAATRSLINIDGSESFKVADACRHAGVSTAAPYRHFSDRQALLDAVAVAGFHELRDEARYAGEAHPKGSNEAVSAIGKAYVAFACREPNLFKLMFGQSAAGQATSNNSGGTNEKHSTTFVDTNTVSDCKTAGRECYEVLLEQLAATLNQEEINEAVIEAAFPLWTFVHGLSFLVIDGNVSVNRMPINIDEQIDKATMRLMPAEVQ